MSRQSCLFLVLFLCIQFALLPWAAFATSCPYASCASNCTWTPIANQTCWLGCESYACQHFCNCKETTVSYFVSGCAGNQCNNKTEYITNTCCTCT